MGRKAYEPDPEPSSSDDKGETNEEKALMNLDQLRKS
jgi:hypothetical protein